jgi:uncharacterized protein (TIGR02145 family)
MKPLNQSLLGALALVAGLLPATAIAQTVVYDIDGNSYGTKKIGNQIWMTDNLKVTQYRNGTAIPNFVTADNTAWAALSTGGRADYRDLPSIAANYGRLYNWFAVNDANGLCPTGWRVPSDAEFQILETFLGMSVADLTLTTALRGDDENIGGSMRDTAIVTDPKWKVNNSANNTNTSGFGWYGGGWKFATGAWGSNDLHQEFGSLWLSNQNDATTAYRRATSSFNSGSFPANVNVHGIVRTLNISKKVGMSVRCLTDAAVQLNNSAGYRLFSSPVATTYATLLNQIWTQGATGAKTTNGSPNVFTLTNNVWTGVTDLTASLPAGQGVLVYVFNDNDYNGQADTQARSLYAGGTLHGAVTPTLNTTASSFTLLGNPYRSTLDFDNLERANLTDVAYVWNPTKSGGANWDSYTVSGEIGDLSGGLIAPFQGFIVQAAASGTPSVGMVADDTTSTAGTFRGKESSNQDPLIRLQLDGATMSSSMWMRFSETGTLESTTKGDALKFESMNPAYAMLAAVKGQTALDIAHLPLGSAEYSIPVQIRATETGTYTLRLTRSDLLSEVDLTFNDHAKGVSTRITENFSVEIDIAARAKAAPSTDLLSPTLAAVDAEGAAYSITVKPVSSTSVENGNQQSDIGFELEQNYPNPFNPSTVIGFRLSVAGQASLKVFDVLGREITTLVDGVMPAGAHNATFDASQLPSGVYLYRLEAGGQVQTKRMILLK